MCPSSSLLPFNWSNFILLVRRFHRLRSTRLISATSRRAPPYGSLLSCPTPLTSTVLHWNLDQWHRMITHVEHCVRLAAHTFNVKKKLHSSRSRPAPCQRRLPAFFRKKKTKNNLRSLVNDTPELARCTWTPGRVAALTVTDGGVKGIYPAPDIHEQFMIHNGYGTLRISSRTTSTTLSAL